MGGWGGVGWFFSDYRVSPNFLFCWGWVVVEVGLGCDNRFLFCNFAELKSLLYTNQNTIKTAFVIITIPICL